MSITLDTITHAVNSFNDIPNITFDAIDIGEFANEVEIYTNTPAVMIPTKLNAMASQMKTWLNSNIATPLEAQQNTFKNEVVVRTNEAMNAVETYINNEVKAFVNDIFVPWANNSGVILSDNANLLEGNISITLAQLMSDYSVHVAAQDAVISQALEDLATNLSQYTTGATDSGYSVHQTNQLVADLIMTSAINQDNYAFDNTGVNVTSAREGDFSTHHIVYDAYDEIVCFGEALEISGEVRPFVNHNVLTTDPSNQSVSIEQIKAYSFTINTDASERQSFRATGHEADGSAAEDLTILNNTSIPDTDNPALVLARGNQYAMYFDGIIPGDYVRLVDLDGNDYDAGVGKSGAAGQYAADGGTILFKPHSSYCHDGISSATGWGVDSSMGAVSVDSASAPAFSNPAACEEYFESNVSILDDFSRTYEHTIVGESYDSDLSDGLIYDVFISDDSGFIDTYAYTIDANSKLGTGAVLNAVYDNGCSDITITTPGTKYSTSSICKIVDVDNVATEAVGSVILGNGSVSEVSVTDGGADYVGYWEITLPDIGGVSAHTHTVQLTQTEINDVMSGTPVTKTTVDVGHTHDVTLVWNAFLEKFTFDEVSPGVYATGDHDHGPISSIHTINPNISVTFSGDGTGAAGYAVLSIGGNLEEVVVTAGGVGYTTVTIIISGGTPTTPATADAVLVDNVVQSINISNAGAGYVDTSPAIVSVSLQNNQFVPATINAKVGDTVRFTNSDLAGHTVSHLQGAFNSPNIPQSGVWDYVITKDTQLTDLYSLSGTGMNGTAKMWVRESTVYVDIISSTGGGCRAKGTVDAAGTLINVSVVDKGFGYTNSDVVRILDVSGPGEGAFADVVLDRTLGDITITNAGTGYAVTDKIIVVDPTGMNGTFGSGAEVSITSVDDITGAILETTITKAGANFTDLEFIIISPTGTGATLTPDLNVIVKDINLTARGTGYVNPTPIVIDPSGSWGSTTTTVGGLFEGTATLNDGIGGITIVDDWKNYVDGGQRVTIIDVDPNPTGYGATATAELNAQGAVSNVTIVNAGSAYKSPQVTVDGPVLYTGDAINQTETDLALFGPEGNTDASPFSANDTALTNFKNGIMIQFLNPNGHTLNDSWEFKLQSWKKGTPESLLYKTYQYDGVLINTSGIINLKDMWEA